MIDVIGKYVYAEETGRGHVSPLLISVQKRPTNMIRQLERKEDTSRSKGKVEQHKQTVAVYSTPWHSSREQPPSRPVCVPLYCCHSNILAFCYQFKSTILYLADCNHSNMVSSCGSAFACTKSRKEVDSCILRSMPRQSCSSVHWSVVPEVSLLIIGYFIEFTIIYYGPGRVDRHVLVTGWWTQCLSVLSLNVEEDYHDGTGGEASHLGEETGRGKVQIPVRSSSYLLKCVYAYVVLLP